ncbi:MAG TPA: FtsX-like permease family protein [Streptosporangiaceae bacterium]|nr:FtsX-like permease family protein [Streptosporangiaceae bacterium]
MSLLALWLRREARLRWPALLACCLLVAITSATVLTAVAGARRGASTVSRLLAVTRPATAEVVPNQAGFDWNRIRTLPEVEALTTFPAYTSLPTDAAPDDTQNSFVPADTEAMRTIETPVVLAGRLADPARPDEAVVTPAFVRSTGRGVGDTVTARLTTPEQASATFDTSQNTGPGGPEVRLRIVGVVRSLWYGDDIGGHGVLIPSPGLMARYRANFLGAAGDVPLNAIVRLRGGEADLPAFRADLARVTRGSAIDVFDMAELAGHYRSVTGFESACLLAFALAVFLAGLVLAGQAIARLVAASAEELRLATALGLTRFQGTAAAVAGPAAAAAAGAAVGVALAIIASRWMPFGVAATKEPDPGMTADWLVLGSGLALFPALAVGVAAATAWLALGRAGGGRAARRSAVAQVAVRAGLPVSAVVGVRFALEPGRGANAVPARAALLGAVSGVLGVIAAFTFAAGVSDAAAHPARFGQDYQFTVVFGSGGRDFLPNGPVLRALAADPAVTGVTNLRIDAASSGKIQVLAHSYDPVGAPVPLVLTAGVPPARDNELVLAPATARRLGVRVGSVVPLTGNRGTRRMRVTGIGFTMESSTSPYDNGGWITGRGYDALFSGFKEHGGLIALRPGTDPAGALPRLEKLATRASGGQPVLIITPFVPRQLGEIADVRVLPVVLGGFLILLAAGAVGHALMAAVWRRARDIAVLRALGMTPSQSRWAAAIQATVFTVAGLLAGIPLGLAAGRTLWRVTAGIIPLEYQAPVARVTLLLIGPAVLACGLLLALIPGHRAARLHAGPLLRDE